MKLTTEFTLVAYFYIHKNLSLTLLRLLCSLFCVLNLKMIWLEF